ncbi:tRNA dimethylallyltransferase [Bienertia sinuspersici]
MEVQAILEFFRKNNFPEAEFALKQDLNEKKEIFGSFDFEKFLFPMNPLLGSNFRPNPVGGLTVLIQVLGRAQILWDDEFKSLGSSTLSVLPVLQTLQIHMPVVLATQADSDSSSDKIVSVWNCKRIQWILICKLTCGMMTKMMDMI